MKKRVTTILIILFAVVGISATLVLTHNNMIRREEINAQIDEINRSILRTRALRIERHLHIIGSLDFDENGAIYNTFEKNERTDRAIEMYNRVLRNQEPPILFKDRELTFDDIVNYTLEVHDFLLKLHSSDIGALLDLADFRFLRYATEIENFSDQEFHEWGVRQNLWTEDAR